MTIEKVSNSVTHKGKGVVVQPSPLNHIKLELGIALAVAVLVLLLVPTLSDALMVQLSILLGYGVVAAGWLVLRTRKTVEKLAGQSRGKNHQ